MRTGQAPSASNAEYLSQFRKKASNLRIPLSGTLELTSRCNLKCVHCYLGPQEVVHQQRDQEMSTTKVLSLIDEMVAAGTLNLLITGGDPMMRKDFPQIYRHAKEQGLLVTVFCDGVLVTDKMVELFVDLPPVTVEISLYGATAATYEAVTRIPGSFVKCIAGIERLLAANVRVSLKTVLMTLNRHEFYAMEEMAKQYGVHFRFDSAIFPCLPNGDAAPLDLRVSPEEAVEKELSDPGRLKGWRDYYEKRKNLPPSDKLYQCGAGTTGFYVNPHGNMSPCLMTTNYRYSLKDSTFQERWLEDIPKLRERTARADHSCTSCSMKAACGGCPAFFNLETGAEDVKSEYVCSTTRIRLRVING